MDARTTRWCIDQGLKPLERGNPRSLEVIWCAPYGKYYRVMETSSDMKLLADDVIAADEFEGVLEFRELVYRPSVAFEMCYIPEDPESDERAFRCFQAGCQDMGVKVQRGKIHGVMVVTARRDQLDHLASYIFEEAEDNQLDVTMIAVEEGAE